MVQCTMMPVAEALGSGAPSAASATAASTTMKRPKMPFSIDSLMARSDSRTPTPEGPPPPSSELPITCASLDLRKPTPVRPASRGSPPQQALHRRSYSPPSPAEHQHHEEPVEAHPFHLTSADSLQQRLAQERLLQGRLYSPAFSVATSMGLHQPPGLDTPLASASLGPPLPMTMGAPLGLAGRLGLPPGLGGYVGKLAQLRGDLAMTPPHPGMPPGFHPHHPALHPAQTEMPLYPWLMSRHGRVFPGRFAPGPHLPEFLFQPFRKPKRIRTAFSPSQLLKLEHAFEKNHYVVGQERKQLAQTLNLSETQVKVWFQNRRTKHKRGTSESDGGALGGDNDKHDGAEEYESDSDENESATGIDVTD